MQNNRRINIAVLEPSHIIFEGISNILSRSGLYIKLYRIDNLSDIEKFPIKEKLDAVFINPTQIQNKTKEFASIKKSYNSTCFIALIYSFYDQHLLSLFDKTISIIDPIESINEFVTKLCNEEIQSNNNEQETLSEREIDVLKLLVKGLSNKEIADTLNISVHTVISHRKNISQKTGIKSQSGLTIYAISNKIVLLEDYTS